MLALDAFPYLIWKQQDIELTLPWKTVSIQDRQHPCIKSLGRDKSRKTILDMTAGLGTDSLRMAMLGHRVISCEKHPILAAMIQEGVWALRQQNASLQWGVYSGDSIDLIRHYPASWPQPDMILIDPMYQNPSQAKPGRVMQALRQLIPEDATNDNALLTSALSLAKQRVIVKRQRLAPSLTEIKPNIKLYAGKQQQGTRYDIYLIPDG